MGNKVTLQQIADELGTSKVSVSRALNNKPGISVELRNKVFEKAKVYGYDIQTQNDCQINSLAFVIPKRFFLEIDQFYTVIYFHLNHLCQVRNIILTAITFTPEEEQNGKLPPQLTKSKFDGIFVAGASSRQFLESVAALNLPTVFIDFEKSHIEISHVLADNYSIGYEVTDFLIQNGHKEIGFVGDYKNNQNICDRYMGYQKALILNGLFHVPQYDIVNNDFRTGLYTLNFDMPQTLPTAFVCTCDMAAYYLYEKLKMMRIRIPEDVSVISFDNTDICNNMIPTLTSMNIDKNDFANLAFEQLIKQISNPLAGALKLFVRTKLIIRDSVKKLQ